MSLNLNPPPRIYPGGLCEANRGAMSWGTENLAAYGCHSFIVICDPHTLRVVQTLDMHGSSPVTCVAWAPERDMCLASGDAGGAILISDVSRAEVICALTFEGCTQRCVELRWHPSEADLLVSFFEGGLLVLWDLRRRHALHHFRLDDARTATLAFCPFSPATLCVTTGGGAVLTAEGVTREAGFRALTQRFRLRRGGTGDVQSTQMLYSPSHRRILFFALPHEVLIFDSAFEEIVGGVSLERGRSPLLRILLCRQHPDWLYCLHADASVSILQKRRGFRWEFRLLCSSEVPRSSVQHGRRRRSIAALALNPLLEDEIVAVTDDGALWRWALRTTAAALPPPPPAAQVEVEVESNKKKRGTTAAAATRKPRMVLVGLAEGVVAGVTTVRVLPRPLQRPLVALATRGGQLQLMDLESGDVRVLSVCDADALEVIEWIDERAILCGVADVVDKKHFRNRIVRIDLHSGRRRELRKAKEAEDAPLQALALSPARQYFVALLRDRPAEVWDLQRGVLLSVLPTPVTAAVWLPERGRAKKPSDATSSSSSSPSSSSTSSSSSLSSSLPPSSTATPTTPSKQRVVERMACASRDGSCQFYTLKDFRVVPSTVQVYAGGDRLTCLAWKGTVLVSADTRGNLYKWDLSHVFGGDSAGGSGGGKGSSSSSSSPSSLSSSPSPSSPSSPSSSSSSSGVPGLLGGVVGDDAVRGHVYSTNRGAVRRIGFSPGPGLQILVHFSEGDFGVWNVERGGVRVAMSSYLRSKGLQAVAVDWVADTHPIVSMSDGSVRVLDSRLLLNDSPMRMPTHGVLCTPAVAPRADRLRLRARLYHGDLPPAPPPRPTLTPSWDRRLPSLRPSSSPSSSSSSSLSSSSLNSARTSKESKEGPEKPEPGAGEWVNDPLDALWRMLDPAVLARLRDARDHAERAERVARFFGDVFEEKFWTLTRRLLGMGAEALAAPAARAERAAPLSPLPQARSPLRGRIASEIFGEGEGKDDEGEDEDDPNGEDDADDDDDDGGDEGGVVAMSSSSSDEHHSGSELARVQRHRRDGGGGGRRRRALPPLPPSFDVLVSQAQVRAFELQRAEALLPRDAAEPHFLAKSMDVQLLLGRRVEAIDMLLSLTPSHPQYYQEQLRACFIAASVGPEVYAQTCKLVASNLIAAEFLDEGVQLLVLIGKGREACHYLQAHGRWYDAVLLAKLTLAPADCAHVMKSWAKHLLSSGMERKALLVLLSLGEVLGVLYVLHERGRFELAARFADALEEHGVLDRFVSQAEKKDIDSHTTEVVEIDLFYLATGEEPLSASMIPFRRLIARCHREYARSLAELNLAALADLHEAKAKRVPEEAPSPSPSPCSETPASESAALHEAVAPASAPPVVTATTTTVETENLIDF